MALLREDAHWETVTPQMRHLLNVIARQPFSRRFYLAGRTALALRFAKFFCYQSA